MASKVRKNFHQARWDEPIIYEMSNPGVKGIDVPNVEEEIKNEVGDVLSELPNKLQRTEYTNLPEVSQKHVLQHYLHLSQETLGSNLSNDISQGTCTMKYNPKIHEGFVSNPKFAFIHPDQPEETMQGVLEIYYKLGEMIKAISGLDKVSFQPVGGNQAIFMAAKMVQAYHQANGEADKRDEIITTMLSHPANAAAPATAEYKVINIYPDDQGLPDFEAIKEAVSDRTAAIFITNPEDTGLFNPDIDKIVKMVHDVGGLCYYDQANANGFLGITRAKEAGFDFSHFNLHKTFSSPHGGSGPGGAALACSEELAKFLPVPVIEYDEDSDKYYFVEDLPNSVGKIKDFFGNMSAVLRAYSWIMTMGPDGLKETADISILNNNYFYHKIRKEVPDLAISHEENEARRLEQVRYTWAKLKEKTGVGSSDIQRRVADYGIQHYFQSHHPFLIPEPMTLEPCETYSKDDLDEYIEVLKEINNEALENPEKVKESPYKTAGIKDTKSLSLAQKDIWALTWRAYLKKTKSKENRN
ncbi:aminomethyl-transferring glycine dehydrogenase subunit GcvPB [Natranaerofaba carboxydovora]|uniref:aminomethyl-transferring glycine dehydrogenase subunit GcvPB n=1 Tax=Natranaerofaba carboxydovora TaxID=2742683 RepID=UPI001F13DF8A|nr:aminomethyl-transferring glycine dehydrogenase subunit GcvPB [Natranaerofaba carboxydovora]UMZ74293.1 putative glycine dehydrogenase (decarboxylating) subunit 2 [Natranaerofaba carboxydovora]